MKICPVCKARSFSDMEICYACMHRFTAKDSTQNLQPVININPKIPGKSQAPKHASKPIATPPDSETKKNCTFDISDNFGNVFKFSIDISVNNKEGNKELVVMPRHTTVGPPYSLS